MYDDRDPNYIANNSGFYVYTSTGNVYKCIYNGKKPGSNGAQSTIEPTGTSNSVVSSADGYKWKYMYSIPSISNTTFVTSDFITIEENANVRTTAVQGTIDVILLESNGVNYSAYANGSVGTVTNTTVFSVNLDKVTVASIANNSFTGSAIKVSGDNSDTSIREITAWNASTNTITVAGAITDIANATLVEIAPRVNITGDGTDAVAFASMNTSSNGINTITVYDPGQDYSVANVTLVTNTNFRVSDATARAVISPPGGHGSNSAIELGCSRYQIFKSFEGDETSTLLTGMDIRTVSLIKNMKDNGLSTIFDANKFTQVATFDINQLVPTEAEFQQGNVIKTSTANGVVVFANTSKMYVANIVGSFAFNQTINPASLGGNTAGASPDGKYRINSAIDLPEIERDSGQVLYYQNILPTQRADDQAENFRLIIKV